jgi:phosphoribosylanthranilate isomerase
MRTWIKICGTTNLEDAQACVDAGVDALGFIFAESARRVELKTTKQIVSALPEHVEKIGVFVNEPHEVVLKTVREANLTGVQLHGDESPSYVKQLIRLLGEAKVKILKAIPADLGRASGLGYFDGGEDLVDAVMIDSGSVQLRGGTGQVFDWLRAGDFIMWLEQRAKVIVAGGLTPENVRAAVSLFHPYGVDVVTGVETSKGKKDHAKVRAFVESVRTADRTDPES